MKKPLLFICICFCACFVAQAAFPGGNTASKAKTNPVDVLSSAQTRANEAQAGMDAAIAQTSSEPTLEDSYYLGRAVAANILTTYKLYNGNPALTRYLNLICQAILINNPAIGLFKGAYVGILDSPELNALASPGGHIFITRGLVDAAVSEDMLAAIIAHELAHIKLKHGIKTIEEMQFYNDMAAVGDRAFEFSSGSAGARRLAEFRSFVTSALRLMLMSGYSKSQEFEADREALALMAAAGYDPDALFAVFKVLHDSQKTSGMDLNATHPSPVERVVNVDSLLRAYTVPDTRQYRAARFRDK